MRARARTPTGGTLILVSGLDHIHSSVLMSCNHWGKLHAGNTEHSSKLQKKIKIKARDVSRTVCSKGQTELLAQALCGAFLNPAPHSAPSRLTHVHSTQGVSQQEGRTSSWALCDCSPWKVPVTQALLSPLWLTKPPEPNGTWHLSCQNPTDGSSILGFSKLSATEG